jgi:hypothetical protein
VAAPPAASLPDDPPVESVYPELLLIPALRAGGAIKRGFQLLKGLRNKLQDAGEGAQEIPTETPQEILMPDGKNIGVKGKGNNGRVRELPGGEKAAEEFFDRLTKGGEDYTPETHPGKGKNLPNGGWIGYRKASQSDSGNPTIDVKVPGVNFKKIKFLE